GPTNLQRFVYVLDGEVETRNTAVVAGDYVYLPPDSGLAISAKSSARAAVIEKPYQVLEGAGTPEFFVGRESSIAGQPLGGDEALEVRALVPACAAFDFAVNTMTFQPGAA